MFEWRNLYRGFMMGVSDLIPGVSGGTIAVMLGIYDRLLAAISGFFSREWKRHLGFLLPLALGMGTALLSLSKLMDYLLTNYQLTTMFFFLGLVIGILPLIVRQADARRNFRFAHLVILIVSAVAVGSLALFNTGDENMRIESVSFLTGVGLFLAGWLASMAMLLPGISGSFILLVLGVYGTAINALSTLNVPLILIIGSGVIVGFIVSSKGIRYLLARYYYFTYASIIGMIVGSAAVVFPGFPTELGAWAVSAGTFAAGIAVAALLGPRKAG